MGVFLVYQQLNSYTWSRRAQKAAERQAEHGFLWQLGHSGRLKETDRSGRRKFKSESVDAEFGTCTVQWLPLFPCRLNFGSSRALLWLKRSAASSSILNWRPRLEPGNKGFGVLLSSRTQLHRLLRKPRQDDASTIVKQWESLRAAFQRQDTGQEIVFRALWKVTSRLGGLLSHRLFALQSSYSISRTIMRRFMLCGNGGRWMDLLCVNC